MVANLTQLALSTLIGAVLLASDLVPDFACASAGVFGGAVMQLLTLDDRKRPSKKLLLGEILASGTSGWGTYVFARFITRFVSDAAPIEIRVCVLAAIAAGGGGSAVFRGMVKVLRPKWLDVDEGKK